MSDTQRKALERALDRWDHNQGSEDARLTASECAAEVRRILGPPLPPKLKQREGLD